MITTFEGKRISSMLAVLPQTVVKFDDEVDNYDFPPRQTMRLKRVMGYEQHRLAKETSTVSDFAACGLAYMLDRAWIRKDEIGALIVVTLCPDHFVPHVSNIVQAECDLSDDVICLDIAQGCCGFLVGLMQSFMMLEHLDEGKKVVLVNGDVLSHKVSKRDRNDFPLIGDATTITVVENNATASPIYYEMHMDGSRGHVLKIPAGGFRMPSTPQTAEMTDQGDGNYRCLDNMHMDGSEVFNFVQQEVPPLLARALATAGESIDSFDWFLFHQPNKFMLQKLAEKAGIPKQKLPMDTVETFGNPSGSSIPLTAIHSIREQMMGETLHCCLSAFGSGLAWGVMFMDLGKLEHCETIVSDL